MIDKQLTKTLCIFSMIIGALTGIIPLIPALTGLAFTILMFAVAPIVLFYFKKLNLIENFEMEKCLTIGAISGAMACVGFSIVYFICALFLHFLLKIQAFLWIKVLFANFGFMIPMIIFMALAAALFNAFSAFLVSYFIYFKQNKE